LFESVREGRGRLFIMSTDRTNVREVATARHAEQGSFSQDGRRIVFEQRDAVHEEIRASQIVVAWPDGREPRVVATGTDPSWSRDGRSILSRRGTRGAGSCGSLRSRPQRVNLVGWRPAFTHWSRDGARIAFMRDRDDGGADIWVMARDGADARCLTCSAPFR
jgi:Tol biopolymer transport system component